METTYKLTYFPIKALAEPIRYLLNYGGLKFEDVRIEKSQFADVKDDMPFGQVPVLEINEKKTHQSVAISRYLAKILQLAGTDDFEDLEIDSIVDTVTDLRSKIAAYNMKQMGNEKDALREVLKKETIPYYVARFNAIAESGYMALGKLTWADFYFVSMLDYCNGVMQFDIIDGYDNLMTLRKKIQEIPSIKQWIEKRPHSDY